MKLVIVGTGLVRVKVMALEVPPPGVGFTTVMLYTPAGAPAGTVPVIWVADTNVLAMGLPSAFTTEAAVKPVPVIVTGVAAPTEAVFGVMEVITGTGFGTSTVNDAALVPVPVGVVTAIVPLVATAGTVKVSCVALTTVKPVTAAPLSAKAVAPVKLVPVTVTTVPGRPLAGEKLEMAGAGVV